MAWSNKATRKRFTAEKSHSLSFAVRVEDKMHKSIIQPTDECWFTVRPVAYEIGFDDTDITLGTASVKGNGIRAEGVRTGTGEGEVFNVDVQAAALNLDPELEYWYDITYVREGYSIAVSAGEFEVVANVTNRGAKSTHSMAGNTFRFIAGLDGFNLLNVTSSMPMPQRGVPGTSSYVIAPALSTTIGGTVAVGLAALALPAGRPAQVGDIIFSSATPGVLATIVSLTGNPAVATIATRQIFDTVATNTFSGVILTRAQYNALSPKDPNTIYFVKD